jgi:hypothetical protein
MSHPDARISTNINARIIIRRLHHVVQGQRQKNESWTRRNCIHDTMPARAAISPWQIRVVDITTPLPVMWHGDKKLVKDKKQRKKDEESGIPL